MSAPDYTQRSNTPSGSLSERTADDSSRLVETATGDLAEVGEEINQQAHAIAEEAKAQVGEIGEKAKGLVTEQKDLIAGQLGGVSEALQKVAGELESENQTSAQYIRMVADGAERLTSTIRDNDVDDILSMAQDFGRKQPAAFLGAAALLGFAASRFVAASASRPNKGTTPSSSYQANSSGTAPQTSPIAPDYSQPAGGDDAGY